MLRGTKSAHEQERNNSIRCTGFEKQGTNKHFHDLPDRLHAAAGRRCLCQICCRRVETFQSVVTLLPCPCLFSVIDLPDD